MYRKIWMSENGKYKVLVRKFKNDPAVFIGFWKIVGGKNKDIRYADLPKYMKSKIKKMEQEVKTDGSSQENIGGQVINT